MERRMETSEQGSRFDWKDVLERYVRMFLDVRTETPKAHSFGHIRMVARESAPVGDVFGLSYEEKEALFLAALGHDIIQPGLISEGKLNELGFDKKEGGTYISADGQWEYNPNSQEEDESAKATRYFLNNESTKQHIPNLSDEMLERVIYAIEIHSARAKEDGSIVSKDGIPFEKWDSIAKSLYTIDKIVNQKPNIFFAFCNFKPEPDSNERGYADYNLLDQEQTGEFLDRWYSKRAHILDNDELRSAMVKADNNIEEEIKYLGQCKDQYHKEMELLQKSPDLMKIVEKIGFYSVLKISQELGNDEINKGEFEIAQIFLDRLVLNMQEIENDPKYMGDQDVLEIINFMKDYQRKLMDTQERYA